MNDEWKKQYDVFISYAHADADGAAGAGMVKQIKEEIEAALRPVSPHPFAFLDSEALKWGMDWNSRITECIANCRVFVYLLSPNYLKSEYCRRERLIWAQKEIGRGRLNRTTRPVYYIDLPQTDDPARNRDRDEYLICQTNSKPFFGSLEQVKTILISDRIEEIRRIAGEIREQIEEEEQGEESVCTIRPGFNRFFVGRLEELANLNALICEKRKIPVISGGPGMGKTELAVAYAYAYAESFPQGRFMIPMQGVSTWTDALDKMVAQIKFCMHGETLGAWGFPEDLDKRAPEERRKIVLDWLRRRAQKGQLLLLLDNLEDMDLLSDARLRELTDQEGLPDDLRIIATTRLNKIALPGNSIPVRFETLPLKETDALELFCRIGKDRFPFARWPMCGGRPVLDDVPPELRPGEKIVEAIPEEYAALKEIVSLLKGHAWSLEIVAGFMAENFEHYSFREELADLRSDPLVNLTGTTYRGSGVQSPETLLRPTLEKLRAFDRIAEDFGQHILRLAAAASFFPPELVPEYALEGIWKQAFVDDRITCDGGRKKASAWALALEQLRNYRIVNGEGDLLKMHRLTREILQNGLSPEEKTALIGSMRRFLDDFQAETPHMTEEQILPWAGWAAECLEKIESLRKDADFLKRCLAVVYTCRENNLYAEARSLLERVSLYANAVEDDALTASILFASANLHSDLNQNDLAEKEYFEALAIRRGLAEKNPKKFNAALALTLNDLANLHNNLKKNEQAEKEYREALSIRRELAGSDPGKSSGDVAMTLNNLAALHNKLKRYDEAEKEFHEALAIRRELARANPEKFNPFVAMTLNNLATLYMKLAQYAKAEENFSEALRLYRQFAQNNPGKFNFSVATLLYNLGLLHRDLKQYPEAKENFSEALGLYKELARNNPEKFDLYVARTLNDLANLYNGEDPSEPIQVLMNCRMIRPSNHPISVLGDIVDHTRLFLCQKAAELREEAVEIANRYPENPICRIILENLCPDDPKK